MIFYPHFNKHIETIYGVLETSRGGKYRLCSQGTQSSVGDRKETNLGVKWLVSLQTAACARRPGGSQGAGGKPFLEEVTLEGRLEIEM